MTMMIIKGKALKMSLAGNKKLLLLCTWKHVELASYGVIQLQVLM